MPWKIAPLLSLSIVAGAYNGTAAGESDLAPNAGREVLIAQSPQVIAGFELTDQDARPFAFSQLRGQTSLVFFGFTHCPNVCPTALFNLKLSDQSRDRDLPRAKVVMISVDGDRDTPAAMKSYLASFSPDFIGLTGDPRVVQDIAARFSAVFFKGLPSDRSGKYLVEHTSQVYLVDKDGQLRATFYDASAKTIVEVTRAVLAEKN
jgi:protein SCO1/2